MRLRSGEIDDKPKTSRKVSKTKESSSKITDTSNAPIRKTRNSSKSTKDQITSASNDVKSLSKKSSTKTINTRGRKASQSSSIRTYEKSRSKTPKRRKIPIPQSDQSDESESDAPTNNTLSSTSSNSNQVNNDAVEYTRVEHSNPVTPPIEKMEEIARSPPVNPVPVENPVQANAPLRRNQPKSNVTKFVLIGVTVTLAMFFSARSYLIYLMHSPGCTSAWTDAFAYDLSQWGIFLFRNLWHGIQIVTDTLLPGNSQHYCVLYILFASPCRNWILLQFVSTILCIRFFILDGLKARNTMQKRRVPRPGILGLFGFTIIIKRPIIEFSEVTEYVPQRGYAGTYFGKTMGIKVLRERQLRERTSPSSAFRGCKIIIIINMLAALDFFLCKMVIPCVVSFLIGLLAMIPLFVKPVNFFFRYLPDQ